MTKTLINNVKYLLDYYYDEEIKHLEELLSTEDDDFEELPSNLDEAINVIIHKYPPYTNSIAFTLMIIKKELQ